MGRIAYDKMFSLHIGMDPTLIHVGRGQWVSPDGKRFKLQPEVKAWCKENLRGQFAFSFKSHYEKPFIVYFQDEVDRIHFKMRWFG